MTHTQPLSNLESHPAKPLASYAYRISRGSLILNVRLGGRAVGITASIPNCYQKSVPGLPQRRVRRRHSLLPVGPVLPLLSGNISVQGTPMP